MDTENSKFRFGLFEKAVSMAVLILVSVIGVLYGNIDSRISKNENSVTKIHQDYATTGYVNDQNNKQDDNMKNTIGIILENQQTMFGLMGGDKNKIKTIIR
jgi:hypothetical protein